MKFLGKDHQTFTDSRHIIIVLGLQLFQKNKTKALLHVQKMPTSEASERYIQLR
jgi:hypothetical protein